MDNINTANVTSNSTLGNLFRECGSGGDATIPGADFMNQIMLEVLMPVLNTCQSKEPLDLNNPDTYSQLWKAIQLGGGTSGIPDWVSGTTASVVKVDCCYYYANPEGSPASRNPAIKTDNTDWYGCFNSLGELLSVALGKKDYSTTLPRLVAFDTYAKKLELSATDADISGTYSDGTDLVDTKIWTHADLVALGKRPTDNAVIMRANSAILINLLGASGADWTEADVRVTAIGLIGKTQKVDARVYTAANYSTISSKDETEFVMPLKADGSIEVQFYGIWKNGGNLNFSVLTWSAKVAGFFRADDGQPYYL